MPTFSTITIVLSLSFLNAQQLGYYFFNNQLTLYPKIERFFAQNQLDFLIDVKPKFNNTFDINKLNIITVPSNTLSATFVLNGCTLGLVMAVEPTQLKINKVLKNGSNSVVISSSYLRIDEELPKTIQREIDHQLPQSQSVFFNSTESQKAVVLACVISEPKSQLMSFTMDITRNLSDQTLLLQIPVNYNFESDVLLKNVIRIPPRSRLSIAFGNLKDGIVAVKADGVYKAEFRPQLQTGVNKNQTAIDITNKASVLSLSNNGFTITATNFDTKAIDLQTSFEFKKKSKSSKLSGWVIAFGIVLPIIVIFLGISLAFTKYKKCQKKCPKEPENNQVHFSEEEQKGYQQYEDQVQVNDDWEVKEAEVMNSKNMPESQFD